MHLKRIVACLSWRIPRLRGWFLARLSLLVASLARLPGSRFGWFGLWCSRQCYRNAWDDLARELAVTPVSCVRYFEFDFAWRVVAQNPVARCLDVSSPRLFSAFILKYDKDAVIDFVNPDARDLDQTAALLKSIGVDHTRVGYHNSYADRLPWSSETFDFVWSISVLEHIRIPGDTNALTEMWRVLKPGGCLVLTVPVMVESHDEFRSENVYGLKEYIQKDGDAFFFQRWYDESLIKERILGVLPDGKLVNQEVWGEKENGWFTSYQDRWMKHGRSVTCKDPFYMATRFTRFSCVEELPGCGIACLALAKSPA